MEGLCSKFALIVVNLVLLSMIALSARSMEPNREDLELDPSKWSHEFNNFINQLKIGPQFGHLRSVNDKMSDGKTKIEDAASSALHGLKENPMGHADLDHVYKIAYENPCKTQIMPAGAKYAKYMKLVKAMPQVQTFETMLSICKQLIDAAVKRKVTSKIHKMMHRFSGATSYRL